MDVLALSDAVVTGAFGLAGTVVIAVFGLIGRLSLTARRDAKEANEAVRRSEEACLDSLEWAFGRIEVLERLAGIPTSEAPDSLRDRQREKLRRQLGVDVDE